MSTFMVDKSKTPKRSSRRGLSHLHGDKTFNVAKTGKTYNFASPNQTFLTASPNRTYNINERPINQTCDCENPKDENYKARTTNGTLRSNKTYSIPKDQTFSAQNSMNRTIIGPQVFFNRLSPAEETLLAKIEIICTEMRSFIMSMYKFFCKNQNCNWEAVYKLIGEIDLTTQSMINEIFMQQMKIEDEREASDYSSYQSTPNFISGSYERESQSILDDIKSRVDHLNVSARSADSLIEGLTNILEAETKSRKFNNLTFDARG